MTVVLGLLSLLVLGGALVTLGVAIAPLGGPLPESGAHGPGNPRGRYQAGDNVDVWHAGKWYPGRIQAVGTDHYFINYDGFSISWHEWVDSTRLRPRR